MNELLISIENLQKELIKNGIEKKEIAKIFFQFQGNYELMAQILSNKLNKIKGA